MPALVVADDSQASFIGVRFLPGAAAAFLGVPLRDLLDQRVDLGDVWSDGAAVGERLATASWGLVATFATELGRRSGPNSGLTAEDP